MKIMVLQRPAAQSRLVEVKPQDVCGTSCYKWNSAADAGRQISTGLLCKGEPKFLACQPMLGGKSIVASHLYFSQASEREHVPAEA